MPSKELGSLSVSSHVILNPNSRGRYSYFQLTDEETEVQSGVEIAQSSTAIGDGLRSEFKKLLFDEYRVSVRDDEKALEMVFAQQYERT